MNVFGVTGWKNAGKTGLMERLVAEFCRRRFAGLNSQACPSQL
jgi:molybdopterin-guanine dinucleotide biosynthesis protein